MWIVTPLEEEGADGGETHYLTAAKEYVVGRKNCAILLTNDQSISRTHAHLAATDQTLTLKDASKYGTFVNGQRLTENAAVHLKSGDKVTFGAFNSKFSVNHLKPVVSSSCLDNDAKASLSQALLSLGGKLVNSWTEDCTHLAMTSVKVTIKTISALLCCRPIVKPEFFLELSEAVQRKRPPPKAERFIPEIDEPSLNKDGVDLGVILARKQLFAERTFIFLSAKQLKRLSAAVGFGRGTSRLLDEGSLPRELLESPQSCVIDSATGSTQTLISPSAAEWANSVKNIVQRKGLRLIPESEIGLAAIFASCDKYCNSSNLTTDSEPEPKVPPRIPSASLSQNAVVDETLLQAVSQNITAYAANTEPPEGMDSCEVAGVTAVGETPEKKQNHDTSQRVGAKVRCESLGSAPFLVADTLSLKAGDNPSSQGKKFEMRPSVSGDRAHPSTSSTNFGTRTSSQKMSPRKPKTPAQTSPQKQTTLTNFFQSASKKRPLDDDFSPVMSEPKRPVLPSSISRIQTPVTSKDSRSISDRIPAATSQTPLGSGADLFKGCSQASEPRMPRDVLEEPQSRKRKEMEEEEEEEEEIQMEELESIMSEDFYDDEPSFNEGQEAQRKEPSSTIQKPNLNSVEPLSSSKRQRVSVEDSGDKQKRPLINLGKENQSHKTEQYALSIGKERVLPSENKVASHENSKPTDLSSTVKNEHSQPRERDKSSFIQNVNLLKEDGENEPKEETKIPLKAVKVKAEVQEPRINEDLPKQLLLVEFRSLTMAPPPKTKPKQLQGDSCTKNFKCFRKRQAPAASASASAHIIGGPDLLAHNKAKNADLDEWLKDAAEEERQSRLDESLGDDLFRYNPTKLTRRR